MSREHGGHGLPLEEERLMPERLQKVLARTGTTSRRHAEELIREGRVTVNGRVAEIGDQVDPATDAIKVNGRRIQLLTAHRYLVLNKPKGCVSTVRDPQGRPTVLELVPPRVRKGLVPIGRLDYHTEGLIMLTTDGDFAQRVAHPKHGCAKSYEVKVKGSLTPGEIEKLRGGTVIEGRRRVPVRVEPLRRTKGGNSWWRIVLTEGRTRQIREMFFRVGHPVQRLRRVAIGSVSARGLPIGGWRELTPAEVESFAVSSPPPRGSSRGRRKGRG